MKKAILTCSLVIIFIFSGLAQQGGLEYKKKLTQKTKYLPEGKIIRVKSDGKTYMGKFEVISDSKILVGSDTILLANIQDIRSKSLSSALGGGLLTVYGTLGTAAIIYTIVTMPAEGAETLVLSLLYLGAMGFGTTILAITGFTLLIHGKSHKRKNWEYKAITSLVAS